jgi:hypothetical protein
MNIDIVIKETAKNAATEADKIAADEAAKDGQEKAAKRSAERTGKETSDHTDGVPAAGAPGATPATKSPLAGEIVVEDQPSTSNVPPSSRYLKVGDNLFIIIPGTASTRVPTEGEIFVEVVITAAGLKIVDEPRASSSGSEEEQLLQAMSNNFQKLQALYRARKEKLDSRAAVTEAAEVDFQKRDEQTRVWYAEAFQELMIGLEQLSQSWNEFLLK